MAQAYARPGQGRFGSRAGARAAGHPLPARRRRGGSVLVESLVLIALVGLGAIATWKRYRGQVDDTAEIERAHIAAMTPLEPATGTNGAEGTRPGDDTQCHEGTSAPVVDDVCPEMGPLAPSGGGSCAPSAGGGGAPPGGSDGSDTSLLGRGYRALGRAYNAVAGAVPDGAKPIIRGADSRLAGLVFDAGDKLLPDWAKDKALTGAEKGLDWLDGKLRCSGAVPYKLRKLVNKFADIDLEGFRKTEGLEGDWYRLYKTWLAEERPADLGKWTRCAYPLTPVQQRQNGRPNNVYDVVEIGPGSYTRDLQTRPQNDWAIYRFYQEHGGAPGAGASSQCLFAYTGPGTEEGGTYTALESFTGSYGTKVTMKSYDPATGKATLEFEVHNVSDWDSGTRIPEVGRGPLNGRDSVVPSVGRDSELGVGGDFRQIYRWTQEVPWPPQSPGNPGKPGASLECANETTDYAGMSEAERTHEQAKANADWDRVIWGTDPGKQCRGV